MLSAATVRDATTLAPTRGCCRTLSVTSPRIESAGAGALGGEIFGEGNAEVHPVGGTGVEPTDVGGDVDGVDPGIGPQLD